MNPKWHNLLGIAIIVTFVIGLRFLMEDVDIDSYQRGGLPFGLSLPAAIAIGFGILLLLSMTIFRKKE